MKAGNAIHPEVKTRLSGKSDLKLWAIMLSFLMAGLYILLRNYFTPLDLLDMNDLNLYLIKIYEHYKGEPQVVNQSYSYSYYVVVITIAALVLASKYLNKFIEASSKHFSIALKIIVSVCVFILFVYSWNWNKTNFLNLPLIAGSSFALIALSSFFWKRKPIQIACEIVMILLFSLATFPCVFSVTDFTVYSMDEIFHRELHYIYLFGGADQLQAGQRLFSQIPPIYGFLLPIIFCSWQKLFSILSLGDYLQIVRIFDGIYLAIVGVLFYLYSRKRSYLALFSFLLVLPWFHFYTFLLGFPNHTGWRLLSMAMGLSVLYCLRSANLKNSTIVLGITSGLMFMLNPSISISLSVGFLVFLVFRHGLFTKPEFSECVKLFLRFATAFLAVVTILLGIASMLAGNIPSIEDINGYFEKSKVYLKIRGRYGPFDPMLIFVFLHCTFLLIYTGLKAKGKLSFHASFRVGVSAVIIIWLVYYVSYPSSWNIFSYYFLCGFLVIDLLKTALLGFKKFRKNGLIAILSTLAISLFVIPQWYFLFHHAWTHYQKGLSVIEHGPKFPGEMVTGVVMKSDCARLLKKKAELIKQVSKDKKIAYVTANVFMLPKLSGVYVDLPGRDIWGLHTKHLLNEYVKALKTNFSEIYIDSNDSILSGPEPFKKFHQYLEKEIEPEFEFVEEKSDWRIYKKRAQKSGN